MPKLKLIDVNRYYGEGISRVHVPKDVSFFAKARELNLVLGPSGSGKSTSLAVAGGLQTPTSGKVLVDGIDIGKLSSKKRDELHLQEIGFILQSYNLLSYLNVADQFKLIDRVKKNGNVSSEAFDELLEKLAVKKLLKQHPSELLGGQNQRVTITCTLYTNPKIILTDESTMALDSNLAKAMEQLFQDLARKEGKVVITVAHDLRLREYADNVYELAGGKLTSSKSFPDQ